MTNQLIFRMESCVQCCPIHLSEDLSAQSVSDSFRNSMGSPNNSKRMSLNRHKSPSRNNQYLRLSTQASNQRKSLKQKPLKQIKKKYDYQSQNHRMEPNPYMLKQPCQMEPKNNLKNCYRSIPPQVIQNTQKCSLQRNVKYIKYQKQDGYAVKAASRFDKIINNQPAVKFYFVSPRFQPQNHKQTGEYENLGDKISTKQEISEEYQSIRAPKTLKHSQTQKNLSMNSIVLEDSSSFGNIANKSSSNLQGSTNIKNNESSHHRKSTSSHLPNELTVNVKNIPSIQDTSHFGHAKQKKTNFMYKSASNLHQFAYVQAESVGASSQSSQHHSQVIFRSQVVKHTTIKSTNNSGKNGLTNLLKIPSPNIHNQQITSHKLSVPLNFVQNPQICLSAYNQKSQVVSFQ